MGFINQLITGGPHIVGWLNPSLSAYPAYPMSLISSLPWNKAGRRCCPAGWGAGPRRTTWRCPWRSWRRKPRGSQELSALWTTHDLNKYQDQAGRFVQGGASKLKGVLEKNDGFYKNIIIIYIYIYIYICIYIYMFNILDLDLRTLRTDGSMTKMEGSPGHQPKWWHDMSSKNIGKLVRRHEEMGDSAVPGWNGWCGGESIDTISPGTQEKKEWWKVNMWMIVNVDLNWHLKGLWKKCD